MNNSLSLSLELICLIAWLLKHDEHKLDDLVKKAIQNGLTEDLNKLNHEDAQKVTEELFSTILDFLIFLEDSLEENLKNMQPEINNEKIIMPALKKIELDGLNPSNIRTCIKKTKDQLNKEKKEKRHDANDADHIKQVLLQQLLKSWKPSNKDTMN